MKNLLTISLFLFFIIQITAQVDKNKYKKEKIDDIYSYYYSKNETSRYKKYGLLKNNKKILPNIFTKGYSKTPNKIILLFNGVSGMFNLETQQWDIPVKYEKLSYLKGNTYLAKLDGKYGIIDDNNNILIDFKWYSIKKLDYTDNYYIVKKTKDSDASGLFNIISRKLVIPCQYSSIEQAGGLVYFKVKQNKKFNILDIQNKTLFKNWYDELHLPKGGRKKYIVKLNGKMGIIDRNEQVVLPLDYLYIDNTPYKDGSYLAQDKKGNYGCVNLEGKVTMDFKFSSIENHGYGNKNIIAKTENKCGIVRINDGMPYEVTTCDFDNIDIENNIFIVEKDCKYGILNQYGEKITEIDYDQIEGILSSGSYSKKVKLYAGFKKNSYTLINQAGEIISSSEYNLVKPLIRFDKYNDSKTDYLYVKVRGENMKYGLVDAFAKEVVPQLFDEIIARKDNYIVIKTNNMVGLYDIIKKEYALPVIYEQLYNSKDGFIAKKENVFFSIKLDTKVASKKMNFEY